MSAICICSSTMFISCGQSQEEINKKRTQDSLAIEIRKSIVKDSMNKVNGLRIADSISAEINKAMPK